MAVSNKVSTPFNDRHDLLSNAGGDIGQDCLCRWKTTYTKMADKAFREKVFNTFDCNDIVTTTRKLQALGVYEFWIRDAADEVLVDTTRTHEGEYSELKNKEIQLGLRVWGSTTKKTDKVINKKFKEVVEHMKTLGKRWGALDQQEVVEIHQKLEAAFEQVGISDFAVGYYPSL